MKTPRNEACNGFGFQDDDGACDADSGYHCNCTSEDAACELVRLQSALAAAEQRADRAEDKLRRIGAIAREWNDAGMSFEAMAAVYAVILEGGS